MMGVHGQLQWSSTGGWNTMLPSLSGFTGPSCDRGGLHKSSFILLFWEVICGHYADVGATDEELCGQGNATGMYRLSTQAILQE